MLQFGWSQFNLSACLIYMHHWVPVTQRISYRLLCYLGVHFDSIPSYLRALSSSIRSVLLPVINFWFPALVAYIPYPRSVAHSRLMAILHSCTVTLEIDFRWRGVNSPEMTPIGLASCSNLIYMYCRGYNWARIWVGFLKGHSINFCPGSCNLLVNDIAIVLTPRHKPINIADYLKHLYI